MVFKKCILCVCGCLVACPAFASQHVEQKTGQPVKSSSKKSGAFFVSLEMALKNNKAIIEAQKDLLAEHEKYIISRAGFLPKVTANAGVENTNQDRWTTDTPNTYRKDKSANRNYGLSVSQNLFNGLADVASMKYTNSQIRAAWSQYESLKQKTLEEVSESYFTILEKKQEIVQLKALLDAKKNNVDVAKQSYDSGAVKYLDVSQAEAALFTTEAKLSKSNADLAYLIAKFEETVGWAVPSDMNHPGDLLDSKIDKDKALEIAVKYNPGVIAASDNLAAAKEAIKTATAKLLPTVDATYGFNGNRDIKSHNNIRSQSIGVGVKIPIYDAGVGRAERRAASERATKAAVEKDKVVNELKTAIVAIWSNIDAAKQNIVSSKKAIEASEVALRDVTEEYKAGAKIMQDVLDAQEKLFEAKLSLISSEKNYFVFQCKANAILGRMNAKYLKIEDSDFDYKSHFENTKSNI